MVKGPYENAKQEIKKEGLEDKVQARLADGLNAIELVVKDDAIYVKLWLRSDEYVPV